MDEFVTFRRMRHFDLPCLAELEASANESVDPDFGVFVVGPYAWDAQEIHKALKQGRAKGWVVDEGAGNTVAYYVLRMEEDHFDLARLVVHPNYRGSGIGRAILRRIYQSMLRSEARKTLRAEVREDDIETCQWMAHMGFASRVVRNGWCQGLDAVEFTYTTEESLVGEPSDEF